MATTKIFVSIFEIAPKKIFCVFFQLQIDFRIQTNIFWKKKKQFACKI